MMAPVADARLLPELRAISYLFYPTLTYPLLLSVCPALVRLYHLVRVRILPNHFPRFVSCLLR